MTTINPNTASGTETAELVWLDPNTLVVHLDNLRDDLGDLAGLTASIAEIGVLEPLIVTPDGDGYRISAGHRRQAAAIAAGRDTVPCIVRPDLSEETDHVVTMLAENIRRRNLSVAEEARGYEQLSLAGLSPTKIAKTTGSKMAHVKQSLTVAGSEVAAVTTSRYDLTLEQAIVVAQFEDSPEAVKLLVTTAKSEPEQWDHVVGRLRADRQADQTYAAKVAELTASGLRVLDDQDLPEGAVPLAWLVDGDGQPLDEPAHTSCPGHAAVPGAWNPDDIEVYCLDPDAGGHQERVSVLDPSQKKIPSDDEAKANRRRVIENNKAWRSAERVRREFVRTLLARKSPPRGTLRFVAEVILTRPDVVSLADDGLVADLLGLAVPATKRWAVDRQVAPQALSEATDARIPLVLLAQVAANAEQGMGVHTWRHGDSLAARWLDWLADVGHSLSEIETTVVERESEQA